MSKFSPGDWIRTCQECGNVQKAIKPSSNKEMTTSYAYSKCRKCKSEALDYGKEFSLKVETVEEDG